MLDDLRAVWRQGLARLVRVCNPDGGLVATATEEDPWRGARPPPVEGRAAPVSYDPTRADFSEPLRQALEHPAQGGDA
ncbi:MAG: hypothetical protein JRN23_01270, partial [Nitrososphaerota archaeon]|nr:hypothetical protein [Nitrososphaerota archaeon]